MGDIKDFERMLRTLNPRQIVFFIVLGAFVVCPTILGIIYYFIDTDQAVVFLIFALMQFTAGIAFAWTGVPFTLPERLGGFSSEH